MKKRIIALSLAVLTLLCACGKGETPEEPVNENDLSSKYYIIVPDVMTEGADPGAQLLFKINTETGAYTPICSDPVCKHNTDECISYHIAEDLVQHGNYLFFKKSTGVSYTGDHSNTTSYLYRLDLKTGEYEVLLSKKHDSDGFFPNEFMPGDTALFGTMLVVDEEAVRVDAFDPGHAKCHTELFRLDYDTKKVTPLGTSETLTGNPECEVRLLSVDADKVTWGAGRKKYVTDYDLGVLETVTLEPDTPDRPTDERTLKCGDYEYVLVRNTGDDDTLSYYHDLYLIDGETGERKLIAEDINQFTLMFEEQNTIIYRKYHSDPDVIFTKNETEMLQKQDKDYFDYTKNNIYAMNLDGSSSRLLCHIDDPYLYHTTVQSFVNNMYGTDKCVNDCVLIGLMHNFIGTTRDPDDIDEDGFSTGDEYHPITTVDGEYLGGFAIVNIKTGEYKVVYPFGDPSTYSTPSHYASGDITDDYKQK